MIEYTVGMTINITGYEAYPQIEKIIHIKDKYITTDDGEGLCLYYVEDDGYWTPFFRDEDNARKPIIK